MVLIKNIKNSYKPFNKLELIEEITELLKNNHPNCYLLFNKEIDEECPWDFLIIRSLEVTVHEVIGMMNHESITKKRFQQVFAIRLLPSSREKELSYGQSNELKKWVTQFITTDNAQSIMRRLGEGMQ